MHELYIFDRIDTKVKFLAMGDDGTVEVVEDTTILRGASITTSYEDAVSDAEDYLCTPEGADHTTASLIRQGYSEKYTPLALLRIEYVRCEVSKTEPEYERE